MARTVHHAGPSIEHETCRDIRRRLEQTVTGKAWIVGLCGVPTIYAANRRSGRCVWCTDGHKHAEDQPATAAEAEKWRAENRPAQSPQPDAGIPASVPAVVTAPAKRPAPARPAPAGDLFARGAA